MAKLVLPSFGGSAAVWNVSVTFFQVSLLLAYAYAHGSWHRLKHRQPFLHIALIALPLLTLPLALPGWAVPSSSASPTLWFVLVLLVTIGATFTALATSSPLLQAWFSSTTHKRAANPYFLYATGNIGSFVGLLSYPFIIEPLFTLRQQTVGWSVAYGLAVLLVVACAIVTRRTTFNCRCGGSRARGSRNQNRRHYMEASIELGLNRCRAVEPHARRHHLHRH